MTEKGCWSFGPKKNPNPLDRDKKNGMDSRVKFHCSKYDRVKSSAP